VLIGADRHAAASRLPADLPVLRASLRPGPEAAVLVGQNVLAFAGIGRPDKFFAMLRAAGIVVAEARAFADHHRYSPAELSELLDAAVRLGATPVTTPKDAARLAPADRARVSAIGVRLVWHDAGEVEALLTEAMQWHG
jgi:tetraacyldisaccharide 4'-kinase